MLAIDIGFACQQRQRFRRDRRNSRTVEIRRSDEVRAQLAIGRLILAERKQLVKRKVAHGFWRPLSEMMAPEILRAPCWRKRGHWRVLRRVNPGADLFVTFCGTRRGRRLRRSSGFYRQPALSWPPPSPAWLPFRPRLRPARLLRSPGTGDRICRTDR